MILNALAEKLKLRAKAALLHKRGVGVPERLPHVSRIG